MLMRVGNIEVHSIYDGQFLFAPPRGLPVEGDPVFSSQHVNVTEDGLWVMDIGAFLVRTADRLLLIDAGAGPGAMERIGPKPFDSIEDADPVLVAYNRAKGLEGGSLEKALALISKTEVRHGLLGDNLKRLGVAREDITDVALSHLHFDHIGWVSDQGEPYFPNATYRCERHDADFFLGEHAHDETFYRLVWDAKPARERLRPVLDRLELWDRDAVIAPGVNAMFAPGHTPGSCLVVLSSQNERALILGDAVHCPLELTDPDFSLMADMDQVLADRTREAIRREMETGAVSVSAPHFPGLQFGRMLSGQGRRRWSFRTDE
jgi:glyoxylase-like metal-dependent hydrolase (beta-lactamase superfamily II)